MPLTPGQQISHYRVAEKIGEGGMGEVYRAEDTKLGREVALKLLPADVALDQERRSRFEREARAVAALKHPNIVTIYSVEESGGVPFFTMELVEGTALSGMIPRDGFPLARFFEVAIPLADAISSAHEKGITHRDLKPANIMLDSDGRLKVLDFGLAKLTLPGSGTETAATFAVNDSATKEGRVLGTASYMSPEQAEGKAIDHRSDIFSLGIVLYEMATGTRPFQGDSSLSILSAILRDAPQRVSVTRNALPRHLGRIIHRCLEKDPGRRYQTARDVRNELEVLKEEIDSGEIATGGLASEESVSRLAPPVETGKRPRASFIVPAAVLALAAVLVLAWWALGPGTETQEPTGPADGTATDAGAGLRDSSEPPVVPPEAAPTPPAQMPSVAVLPFTDLSPGGDQEYLSDGITEEIRNHLSRIDGLQVAARSSSFSFKGQSPEVTEVAARLGVSNVLEGSVQLVGDRLRVTVQLVNATDGFQLWSERYDRQFADVFSIQDAIAESVAGRFELELDEGSTAAVAHSSVDPEVYDLYLQGRHLADRFIFPQALVAVDQVLERAPDYVPAIALRAGIYLSQGIYNIRPPSEVYPKALQDAERALALEPDSAIAHTILGSVSLWYLWDMKASLEHVLRAIELDEARASTRRSYAWWLGLNGRHEDAISEARKAVELEPFSVSGYQTLAWQLYFAGRSEAVIEAMRQALQVDPTNLESMRIQAFFFSMLGRHEEALELHQQVYTSVPDHTWNLFSMANAQFAAGQKKAARATHDKLVGLAAERWVPPIARVFLGDDMETQFEWLERSVEARDFWLLTLEVDPFWNRLGDDPRFKALVERVREATIR